MALIFYAAHGLEAARGQGGTLFGWGVEEPLPDPTVSEIAEALDNVPLTSIDAADALHARAISADSARYWQEPDGSDELLLAPGLDSALERIAAHIVASSSTSWWSNPMEREQWTLQFRDARFEVPTPPPAGEMLCLWREEMAESEQLAIRERPSDPAANLTGEWWSKPPSALTATARLVPRYGPHGPMDHS